MWQGPFLFISLLTAVLTNTGVASAQVPLTPTADAPAAAPDGYERSVQALVDEAFLATFARFEQSRSRYGAVQHPLNPQPTRVNEAFTHRHTLIGPDDRQVTTPNNDTLYSAGWAELSQGPVEVHIPAIPPGRYWSLAVLDIDTDNIAIVGSGSNTRTPLHLVLVPPGWSGAMPTGAIRLDAPGDDLQVLVRILVDGEADIDTVRKLQTGITMQPLHGRQLQPLPPRVEPRTARDPANFLAVVNESLLRNPLPPARDAALQRWRAVGVGADAPPFSALPADVQAMWRSRIDPLNDSLRNGLGHGARSVGGWRMPDPDVGRFGEDDGLRAAVAYGALGALASSEALYLQLDADPVTGQPLDGRRNWVLDIPAIEAKGFWSISLYELDAEGRMFFTPNKIGHYAIGDRTPNLVREPDGTLRVLLQTTEPGANANWLPIPAGPFAMVLRVYLPSDAIRAGTAPLPVLRRRD